MMIEKNGNYKSYEINLYANFCNINFNYKVISIWLKYVLIIIFIYFFIINFVKGNNNFNLNNLL